MVHLFQCNNCQFSRTSCTDFFWDLYHYNSTCGVTFVAREIAQLVHFPNAREIEFFGNGKVAVLGLRLLEKSPIIDKKTEQLDLPQKCQIIGVDRDHGNFRLYTGKEQISAGDIIYVIGEMQQLKQTSEMISSHKLQNKRILILGGTKTGYHLVKDLEEWFSYHDFKIKIIERDHNQCDFLKRNLKYSIVLSSDFYNQEEISESHVVISTIGDDQINIITS